MNRENSKWQQSPYCIFEETDASAWETAYIVGVLFTMCRYAYVTRLGRRWMVMNKQALNLSPFHLLKFFCVSVLFAITEGVFFGLF